MLLPSVFENGLFEDFMKMPEPAGGRGLMKTDVKELSDSYKLHIDLPGVKKEDIDLKLSDGYLEIRAETFSAKDEEDENGRYVRRERYKGALSRGFYVGETLKPEDVRARFEDGVLEITVPKAKPEEIKKDCTIQIEG